MTTTSPAPTRKVLLINGPNLNLLGFREPAIYGSTTLAEVVTSTVALGKEFNIEVVPFQSNHEGAIVDFIHSHFVPASTSPSSTPGKKQRIAILLNPAAFTHTSVAIRDALLGTSIPFLEIHISNVHAREPWRSHSYFSDKAVGIIMGLGTFGYRAGLEYWAQKWDAEDKAEGEEK
jgi:3-dehydroquinate dehydratase II